MRRCDNNQSLARVLAVASYGGHLVQLERIIKPLEAEGVDVAWATTRPVAGASDRYEIADFSRCNAWVAPKAILMMARIIWRVRPDCVVTTGAAPGLAAVIAARMLGVRSLWIDSLANVDRLSLSGRIATALASDVLSQWSHLASGRVKYYGSILS